MTFNMRTYRPPGPMAESFLRDRSPVRFIKGPIGSGKTNACFFDALTIATQMPKCIDGKRRFKGLIFRDTYGKLWDTVIKSWWQWFPESAGKWSGQHGRLAAHALRFNMADGGELEFEMQFRALDESADIEDALKGVEVSWAQLNEADTLSEDVLTHVLGRVLQRRYPPHRLLPSAAFKVDEAGERTPNYFAGVVGDLNPPEVDNWVYELFEEKRPAGHRIFHQPGGRTPRGENREGVSLAAYRELATVNASKPWWVKRMIDGEYGYSRDGQPVYPGYQDERHCSEEDLEPIPGLPLRLSFDQGVRGPAMIVRQFTYSGQVRVLNELVPGIRMGPSAFGEKCRDFLLAEYPGWPVSRAVCDPAGFAGADTEKGDLSWIEIVASKLGIIVEPAPTNEIQARIDGVAQLLEYFPDGEPAIVISKKCKHLRKGFNSHYRYKIDKNKNTPDPVPEKNLWSNPHDALQYAVLDDFGLEGVRAGAPGGERGRGLKRIPRADEDDDDEDAGGCVVAKSDFNVFKS
jgi:hypothetical protein